jgi:hypothetical protein
MVTMVEHTTTKDKDKLPGDSSWFGYDNELRL